MFKGMQWLIDIIKATVSEVPSGTICLWHGLIADIPDGWVLCDGNNGTPNLDAKFVYGTISQASIGNTGGSLVHVHTVDCGSHNHKIFTIGAIQGGAGFKTETQNESVTGTTNQKYHLPPWHQLAYIMKT